MRVGNTNGTNKLTAMVRQVLHSFLKFSPSTLWGLGIKLKFEPQAWVAGTKLLIHLRPNNLLLARKIRIVQRQWSYNQATTSAKGLLSSCSLLCCHINHSAQMMQTINYNLGWPLRHSNQVLMMAAW